ncbi:hypothetical protein CB1_001108083 [Camelus ferus]|nr:hypothetical protein CB1_001108083 [Camelus ferus]
MQQTGRMRNGEEDAHGGDFLAGWWRKMMSSALEKLVKYPNVDVREESASPPPSPPQPFRESQTLPAAVSPRFWEPPGFLVRPYRPVPNVCVSSAPLAALAAPADMSGDHLHNDSQRTDMASQRLSPGSSLTGPIVPIGPPLDPLSRDPSAPRSRPSQEGAPETQRRPPPALGLPFRARIPPGKVALSTVGT